MARIRSVHPGIYTDEAAASVSIAARWLLTGLWVNADDGGGFAWKPVTLKMSIFPGDNVDVSPLLDELERQNIIKKYEFEGRQYGAIRNFGQFQSPRKPNRTNPMPAEFRKFCCSEHVLTKQEAAQCDKRQNQDELKEGKCGKSPNSCELKGDESRKSPNSGALNECQYGIGEGEGEGKGEDIPSLRSGPPEPVAQPDQPVDARTMLFREGETLLHHMTGKPKAQCRALTGKWLKTCRDRCDLLLSIIREAAEHRPADVVSWIEGAVRHRTSKGPDAIASQWNLEGYDLDAGLENLNTEVVK